MKNKKGMTLIEIIIAMTILMIIYAMADYSAEIIKRKKLSESIYILEREILNIRELSLLNNKSYEILFFNSNNIIVSRSSDGKDQVGNTKFGGNVTIFHTNLKNNKITYNSNGITGDACTVILNNGNYYQKITIPVGGGDINIHDMTDGFIN